MRRRLFEFFTLSVLLALAGVPARAAAPSREALSRAKALAHTIRTPDRIVRGTRVGPDWSTDRVLVRWRVAPPAPETLRFSILRTYSHANASAVRVPAGSTVEATLAALRADPRVLYAEPNVRRRILTLAPPNEPTWGVKDPRPDYTTRSGDVDVPAANQQTYTWALEKVQALAAWNVYPGTYYTAQTKSANPVKIAVLDTGVDLTHPDWINAGGTSPEASKGGQLDIAEAASFLNGDSHPGRLTDDPVGHGTFTAGIVGAAANNGGPTDPKGGAIGLAYALQVLPIQVLDTADSGTVDDEINGIYYAVDHGAQVISMSLGDYTFSPFEQEAVDYAWANNVLVVAAAGNDAMSDPLTGQPGQNRPLYPAADNHVLAVGATGIDDYPASYSNHGWYLGIGAPGGDAYDAGVEADPWGIGMPMAMPTQFAVWSTLPTTPYEMQTVTDPTFGITINDYMLNNYDYAPGTSAACPFVAALAGLYAQKNDITRATPNAAAKLYQAIQRYADNVASNLNGGWDEYTGFGRINALNTLTGTETRGATVGCIVGKVTSNGVAVSGATVRATKGSTTVSAITTANGTYRIKNVGAGTWTVAASSTASVGSINISVLPGVDNFGADFTFPWPAGDMDHNGIVDLRDAVVALRMLAGTDPVDVAAEDRGDIYPWAGTPPRTHGDSKFTVDDVRQILSLSAGTALK